MERFDMRYVRGHVEVFDWRGEFCFSADSMAEAWRNCASSPPRDVAFTAPGKGGIIAKNTAAWREGGCLWPAAQTRS